MVMFWLLAALLLVAALVFIWLPFLAYSSRFKQAEKADAEQLTADDRNRQNVNIFKNRLAELQQELDDGVLDATSFTALKQELEKTLLVEVVDDTASDAQSAAAEAKVTTTAPKMIVPLCLTAAIPAIALALYFQWGFSDELEQRMNPEFAAQSQAQPTQIAERIRQLEVEVQQNPENPEGWLKLAQVYMALGEFQSAADVYVQLTQQVGEVPQVLSQHAQALYMLNDQDLPEKGYVLLHRALELAPDDPGALGLLGIDAYQKGEYQQAISFWQQVLASNNPDTNVEVLQNAIAQAQAQLDGMVDSPVIEVQVALSETLLKETSPDTTVFVLAQALNGPRMPLAVVRLQVSDLPAVVELNDAMAMAPTAKLSSATEVVVRALVSHSGTAKMQPGDFVGAVQPVAVAAGQRQQVEIIIEQVVPGSE